MATDDGFFLLGFVVGHVTGAFVALLGAIVAMKLWLLVGEELERREKGTNDAD